MKRMIASPVRQNPRVLHLFLERLRKIEGARDVAWVFIDDNHDAESSALLCAFQSLAGFDVTLTRPESIAEEHPPHHWNDVTVWKVGAFKDAILAEVTARDLEGVLLVDSDVIVPDDILTRLASSGKDIVSNIFWTKWQPQAKEMPQVWMHDQYEMTEAFIEELRRPGLYPVGGLGACTWISRRAIDRGVSFQKLPNVSFWGEDRHFCIRAAALGLELWVDTRKVAIHLYSDEDLRRYTEYLALDARS